MIAVTKVIPLKNYLLEITMSDGRIGVFDIKPYCSSDYFKEILHAEYFSKVRPFFRGIGWPNGQDIGPDTIAHDLILEESTLVV